ncbi:MAG: ATP-binding protein [Anaerolineales bacterium]
MIGTEIAGRYKIEELLGAGGLGSVYRAHDQKLDRPVAIKILHDSSLNASGRERLLAEAQAAAQLNHPNIITIHDVARSGEGDFIVMEFASGGSLRDQPPGDMEGVLEAARQICAALEHAHRSGIIHRDLKPENVLISSQGDLKLSDFGLARSLGSETETRDAISGTVHYMAPEVALGEDYDGRADLYALGVMLYELVCGRLPFEGDDPLAVLSQHLHTPVVPPRARRADIPLALDQIILDLLKKSPNERLGSAAQVADRLEGIDLSASAQEAETPISLIDSIVRGRLVGRETELETLRSHWEDAMQGRGQMVLISGEPGVGKTRLAEELVAWARLNRAEVLRGGCYEYEATIPYLPLTEALREWVSDQPGDELQKLHGGIAAELSKLAPEITDRLGAVKPNPPLAPDQERLRLFDNLSRFMGGLAARSGLLLYVDDLHWADQGTLSFLYFLLRRSKDERILFLGAYREVELDRAHPLSAALVDWNRERLLTRVQLGRLTFEDCKALLASMFEQESVSEEFARAIFRETEGNPFFIEEVVKSLIESGGIYRENGRWQREEIENLAIPQSVKEAIGRRLDRISQESIHTLRTAAGLGKTFDFSELAAGISSAGLDLREEGELLDTLEEAVSAHLVRVAEGESFAFTHDKIREVLYEELNPIRRRRLHQRLGSGMERLYGSGEIEAHIEDLAYHFLQSGDLEKGLDYALQAASKSTRLYAFEEALGYYECAADSAESLNRPDQLYEIYLARGDIKFLEGLLIPSVDDYLKALELAPSEADSALVKGKIGAAYGQVSDERGLNYLEDALNELDPETQTNELAFALAILGRYNHYRGQHKQAVEYLERARDLAEPLDEPLTLSFIYTYLAGAYQHQLQFERSNYWAEQSIELGQRKDSPLAVAAGYEFLAENSVVMGRWEKAEEFALEDKKIGEQTGALDRIVWAEFSLGNALYGLGKLAEAKEITRMSMSMAEQIGEGRLLGFLTSLLSLITADQGEIEQARELAERGLSINQELGQVIMESWSVNALGNLAGSEAEQTRVLGLCQSLAERIASTDNQTSKIYLCPVQIGMLLGLGRLAEAQVKIEDFLQVLESTGVENYAGIAARLKGEVFHQLGDLESGERFYLDAAARFETLGSRVDLARTLLLLGRLYIDKGEIERARNELEKVDWIVKECGAQRYTEEIEILLGRV